MSTLYTPTNDTTNAARVSLLIGGPCRQLFRDIFREEMSDIQFPAKLKDNEIKKILYNKSGLNKSQKIILYPPNGRFNASYDILDFSLLYSLIRNLSKHQPHKKGWGDIPDHSDRSVSANIDRIRYIRNTHCGHVVDFSLSDTKFSQIWGELAVCINELEQIITGGCTTYTEAVKHLKTVDMDPNQSAEYLQKINKQQQTIEDLKDIDATVRDLINEQKTMQLRIEREQFELKSKQLEHDRRIALLEIHTRPERENIKESTKAILKTHIESKVYFRTSSVQTTIAKLKEHGMVILSGKCGEGKSTTAYQVMHEISIENGSSRNPIIITEPEQWYKVINPQDCFVIYLEDIVGSTNLDGRTVEQWGKNIDTIYASIKNGKVLVIIGIRDSLLPEAKERFKHKLFQEAFEINLSSEEYSLTDNEKREMIEYFEKQMIVNQSSCKSHVQQVKENERCKLTDKEITKIIKTDPFYGFPLTCWQFFSNTEFFRLGYEFFNHPDKNLLKSIEKKRKSKTFSEQLSYALLACVLVKGKLTPEKNEPDEILRRVCHELEIDIGKIKPLKMEDALEEIKELFLKQTSVEGEYTFSHEAVLEAVLISFGKVAPDLVIGCCDMRKLRELVRTQGSNASEIVLKISKQNYIHLAKRLLRANVVDRINCNTWDIAEDIIWHPATEDPEFVEALLSCTESAKSLEILPRFWYVIPGSFSSVMLDKLLELYGPHKIPAVENDSRSRHFESNSLSNHFPKT